MILVCGIPSEQPLELVLEAARRSGRDHVVFNQRRVAQTELRVHQEGGEIRGTLHLEERDVPLESITGIYVRLMDHRALPENEGTSLATPRRSHSDLLHSTLLQLLEVARCRVMNRASAMASNMSKPYQAQLCRRVGFEVPSTLVSNDPDEIRAFRRRYGRVIYKSTSAVRSIVRELEGPAAAELERVRILPTQFQAYIPGTDIRVHVTGSRLYAIAVHSEAIDYRYAGRDGLAVEMEAVALPEAVEARCFELSRRLRLPLCGIDLRRTPEGAYYCFEVNPSPAFSYYQGHTNVPIADGIVDWLVG